MNDEPTENKRTRRTTQRKVTFAKLVLSAAQYEWERSGFTDLPDGVL